MQGTISSVLLLLKVSVISLIVAPLYKQESLVIKLGLKTNECTSNKNIYELCKRSAKCTGFHKYQWPSLLTQFIESICHSAGEGRD